MTTALIVIGLLVWFVRLLYQLDQEGEAGGEPPFWSTYLLECLGAVARMFVTILAIIPIQLVRFALDLQARAEYYSPAPFWENVSYVFTEELNKKIVDTLLFAFLVGFLPVLWSLFTLLVAEMGSGRSESRKLGARRPTAVLGEAQAIERALSELLATASERGVILSKPLRYEPVIVIDNPLPNSYTVGRVMYLTSGVFKTPYVKTLLAHELGHLKARDGRLLLALRRLIIPLAYWIGIDRNPKPIGSLGGGTTHRVEVGDDAALYYKMKTLTTRLQLSFWLGGLGLLFKAQEWADAWKIKDYQADRVACLLDEGLNLKQFLSEYQELETAQPYLPQGRPYAAERMEQINGHLSNLDLFLLQEKQKTSRAHQGSANEGITQLTKWLLSGAANLRQWSIQQWLDSWLGRLVVAALSFGLLYAKFGYFLDGYREYAFSSNNYYMQNAVAPPVMRVVLILVPIFFLLPPLAALRGFYIRSLVMTVFVFFRLPLILSGIAYFPDTRIFFWGGYLIIGFALALLEFKRKTPKQAEDGRAAYKRMRAEAGITKRDKAQMGRFIAEGIAKEGIEAFSKMNPQPGQATPDPLLPKNVGRFKPDAEEESTPVKVTSLLGLLGVGDLKEWVKSDGAAVKQGEVVAKITLSGSDHIAEEVTATANGTLRHKVSAGAEVAENATIAVIETPQATEEQRQVAEVTRLMLQVSEYIKRSSYTKASAATFAGVLDKLEALNQQSLHQDNVRELVERGRKLITERTQPDEQRGKCSS
jgi:hypothetical protein